MKRKRILAFLLSAAMVISGMTVAFAESDGTGSNEDAAISGNSAFQQELESKYIDPDRVYSSDVRGWLSAGLTDETLLEEIQALYDGGFRGVELCMQSDGDAAIYGYGGEQWAHK